MADSLLERMEAYFAAMKRMGVLWLELKTLVARCVARGTGYVAC